jgi:hypothetical protein
MIGGASKLSPAFALALLTLATSPLLPPVTLMLSLLAPVTPMMALELLPEPLPELLPELLPSLLVDGTPPMPDYFVWLAATPLAHLHHALAERM